MEKCNYKLKSSEFQKITENKGLVILNFFFFAKFQKIVEENGHFDFLK